MGTSQSIAGAAALAAAGLLSAPLPWRAILSRYLRHSCLLPDGQHGAAVWADTSPPTRAEPNFAQELSTHYPGVPTTQWVQYARASCWVLYTGASPFVVKGLAQQLE